MAHENKQLYEEYREIIQERENKENPWRKRELYKILNVVDTSWWYTDAVFLEKFKIAEKKLYNSSAINNYDQLYGLIPKGTEKRYINEDGKVCALLVKYGKTNYNIVQGIEKRLAPICCNAKDFDNYKVGDEIIIYVRKQEGIDGTFIHLYLYDIWN